MYPEYRCRLHSQSTFPSKSWTISLFIKWNWNERKRDLHLYNTFHLRRISKRFTNAAQRWFHGARRVSSSALGSGSTAAPWATQLPLSPLFGFIQQRDQTHLLNEPGRIIYCLHYILQKRSVWKWINKFIWLLLAVPGRYKSTLLQKGPFCHLPAPGAGDKLKRMMEAWSCLCSCKTVLSVLPGLSWNSPRSPWPMPRVAGGSAAEPSRPLRARPAQNKWAWSHNQPLQTALGLQSIH